MIRYLRLDLTGFLMLFVLAYSLNFAILARAGEANLLLVTLLIPPFAIALGVMFPGEGMGGEAWIGFAIIAVGLPLRMVGSLRGLPGADPCSAPRCRIKLRRTRIKNRKPAS